MLSSKIDHIVIGAKELLAETKQLEAFLNAKFLPGGKHSLMGTHNRLLKLQDSIYLEVIAIDPNACPPGTVDGRKRWFSLDNEFTKKRLSRAAQPLTWVLAVKDIHYASARCGYDPGEIIEVSRDKLKWRLTVPADGSLSEGGTLPSLIEWPNGRNPTHQMPESGVRLEHIVISHPEPRLILEMQNKLNWVGPLRLTKGKKCLKFQFRKGNGDKVLLTEL